MGELCEMKHFFKFNFYLSVLVLVVIAFLGYQAMKTGNCVEVDNSSIRIGDCRLTKSVK